MSGKEIFFDYSESRDVSLHYASIAVYQLFDCQRLKLKQSLLLLLLFFIALGTLIPEG